MGSTHVTYNSDSQLITIYSDCFTIKRKIRGRFHPVLQYEKACSGRESHVHGRVIMSEHEIIYIIADREVFGKLIERFVLSLEDIFLMSGKTVAFRPAVAQTEGNPRMQKAEKELQDAVVEGAAEESVPERHRAQPIAMSEAEPLAIHLHNGRLLKAPHA